MNMHYCISRIYLYLCDVEIRLIHFLIYRYICCIYLVHSKQIGILFIRWLNVPILPFASLIAIVES